VNGKTGGDISTQISVSGNVYAINKSASDPASGTEVSGSAFSSNYVVNGVTQVLTDCQADINGVNSNGYGQLDVALSNSSGSYVRGHRTFFLAMVQQLLLGHGFLTSCGDGFVDIKRIVETLGKWLKLRGVTWQRLDGVAQGIGFIAQEVQDVFPEFVSGW
jgi:hypothetical protein